MENGSSPPGLPGQVQLAGEDRQKLNRLERLYEGMRGALPGIPEISADNALDLFRKNEVVFVDVRTRREQSVSMLPGTLTKEEFLRDPDRYQDNVIIVYCTVGWRSGKFIQQHPAGQADLKNMWGGVLAWLHAGGKLFDERGESHRVHVFGKKWALQPSAYDPVFNKS